MDGQAMDKELEAKLILLASLCRDLANAFADVAAVLTLIRQTNSVGQTTTCPGLPPYLADDNEGKKWTESPSPPPWPECKPLPMGGCE